MTSQDELRARIEHTLAQAGARGKDRAQAIIDELGLEREVSELNSNCKRYVSKWELWEQQ